MSTSSRLALESAGEAPALPFSYKEPALQSAANAPAQKASLNISAAAVDLARQEGLSAGELRSAESFRAQLQLIRESVSASIASFARERAEYFAKVETEVVQLALAIARQILHREAQVDPLLLAGLVRVALEKVKSATSVKVRVNPHNLTHWQSCFAQTMEAITAPTLIEDAALEYDRCIIETSLGTTELSVELQLKEIERGFLDLLAKRPHP